MKVKVNKPRFVDIYLLLDDKIKFLQSFDLINLQKAAKIGNIPSSKLKTKRSAIKSILAFDLKNKFLICQNIFDNLSEYYKKKVDDVYTFKTTEWNLYEFDHMRTKEWELIRDDLQKELKIFFNQVNINAQNVTIPLGTLQEPNTEIPLSSLDSTKTIKLNKTTDSEYIGDIMNNNEIKERIVTTVKEIKNASKSNKKTQKANAKTNGNESKKSSSKVSLDQSVTNEYDSMNDSDTSMLNVELAKKTEKTSNNKINKKINVKKFNEKENTFINSEINTNETQVFDVENPLNDLKNWNNNNEELNIKYEIQNIDSNMDHKTIKEYILSNLSKLNQIIQEILNIKSNLNDINTYLANFAQLNKLPTIEKNLNFNQKILNDLEENINKMVANQEKLLNSNTKHQDFIDHICNDDFSKLASNIDTCKNTINQIMDDNKNILNLLLVINNKIKLNSSSENDIKKDSSNVNNENSSIKDKLFNSITQINNMQEAINSYQLNNKNNEKLNNHICCVRYKIKTANTSKIDDDLLIQEQIRHKNNLEQLWKKYEEFKSNNKCNNSLKDLHNDINKTNEYFIHNDESNNLLKNALEKLKNLKEQNNRLFKEIDILKSQYYNKDLFNIKTIKKVLNTTSAK